MTNAKEKAARESKSSKPKKANAKNVQNSQNVQNAQNAQKVQNAQRAENAHNEWKKVGAATGAVAAFKDITKERKKRLRSYGTVVHIRARKHIATEQTPDVPEHLSKSELENARKNDNKDEKEFKDNLEAVSWETEEQKKEQRAPVAAKTATSTTKVTHLIKEPTQPEEDAASALKNSTYLTIKNAFSLAYGDDEQLKISVDNIFPLLKSLGLNPQSENVVDLVREASIETFGDIDLADFENVVLGMVKEIDETLWGKRLEEKDRLHHEREAAKAAAEADRLRLEQERKKAGFEKEEEDTDEWQEYERKLKEEAEKKEKELKEDELYDNLKMAFKFIDADEDGVISTQDLYVLMMGLGEMMTDDELFGMVNMADADCDGKVTFEDFKKFLLPQSGDENLILSPAALAQQLLQSGTDATGISQPEDTENNTEGADDKNELVTDNTETTEDTQKSVTNTQPGEQEKTPANNSAPELSDEEKARLQKRRQSMLWGYMNTPKSSSTNSRRTSIPSTTSDVDEVFEEKEQETTINVEHVKETNEDIPDGGSGDIKTPTPTEVAGQFLGAIKEEDEHSNYGIVNSDDENIVPNVNGTSDGKLASALEAKRKLFSRQSSSASVKTKNTESFADSGFETMDSVNCSEIREQPDVFDISDSEAEGEKKSKLRRPSLPKDIYSGNEDDEDMIDPLHVHESLSRVSSSDSLLKLDLDSDDRLPHDSSDEYTEERVRNFVNEHTYIEIQPSPPPPTQEEVLRQEEIKRAAEERMNRAQTLERVILQRSFTSPALTLYRSSKRPLTARPSVNGIHCSHIAIDLRCDEPPKADIKSLRQFKERINSARSSRRENESQFRENMSIIDISKSTNSDENLQNQTDRQKWPMRPLTRPRSPIGRKLFSPCEKQFSLDLETDAFERLSRSKENLNRRRAKSAAPLRRSCSPSLSVTGDRKNIERPQTASLPYTSTRYENDKKRNVLVVEPLANADELYPNKTALTTYHHGFRSIWPIGRKINLIQTKKPFQAFEMNSYSRNIERRQFPLKADHSIKTTKSLLKSSSDTIKISAGNKSVINLEMETGQMKKPSVRKLSLYITPNSTPRAVR